MQLAQYLMCNFGMRSMAELLPAHLWTARRACTVPGSAQCQYRSPSTPLHACADCCVLTRCCTHLEVGDASRDLGGQTGNSTHNSQTATTFCQIIHSIYSIILVDICSLCNDIAAVHRQGEEQDTVAAASVISQVSASAQSLVAVMEPASPAPLPVAAALEIDAAPAEEATTPDDTIKAIKSDEAAPGKHAAPASVVDSAPERGGRSKKVKSPTGLNETGILLRKLQKKVRQVDAVLEQHAATGAQLSEDQRRKVDKAAGW